MFIRVLKRLRVFLLVSLLILFACVEKVENPNKFTDCRPGVDSVCYEDNVQELASIIILTQEGDIVVPSEVVSTPVTRSLGLMYKDSLPENQGMFFIFQQNTTGSFWMKNVQFPLDIIFISYDYKVLHIEKDLPPCPRDPCLSFGPELPYLYVLEVNGGFTKKHRVGLGDKVRLPKVYI